MNCGKSFGIVTSCFIICIMVTSSYCLSDLELDIISKYEVPLPPRMKGRAKGVNAEKGASFHDFVIDIPGQRSAFQIDENNYLYWDFNKTTEYKVIDGECTTRDISPYTLPILDPMTGITSVVFHIDRLKSVTLYCRRPGRYQPGQQNIYLRNFYQGNPRVSIPVEGYLIDPLNSFNYQDVTTITQEEADSFFPPHPTTKYNCVRPKTIFDAWKQTE